MSFKTEIEAIVGDIDSPDYTAEAVLYLVEGVKYITKYVMRNVHMAERLTSSATLNNSTTTLSTSGILHLHSVVRSDGTRNRKAIEISADDVGDYTDANSIYYTSKFDPKWYISNDVINVIPTPTASQTATVRKIQPDTSVALTDTSLDNFPDELERGVVLYASKEMLRKFLSTKNAALPANMSIPSTPSTATVGTVTVGSLGSSPAYTKTSLTLTTAPSISALDIGASAPASITLGSVAYTDASVGDAATTGEAVGAITIPSITDANVTTNVPTYSKPSSVVDFATNVAGAGDALGFDDWIADEDPEMAGIALAKQAQLLEAFQTDIQNELNEFNKDNVRYQAEIQEELTKHNTALQKAVSQAQIDAADAQQESQLAATRNLQNQQKDLQIKLEAAAKDMEVIIAQNSAKVADYNARIQLYQAQVNDEVQQYQLNLQRELELFNTKRNTELQKHQNDIQDELNEFNKELAIYQADLTQKIKQAEVSSEKEAYEIQNYATEVESYGQQIAKEVQNFSTKLQKLTTDYQWYLDQYNKVSQDLLDFLSYYILVPQMEEENEIATDDRTS